MLSFAQLSEDNLMRFLHKILGFEVPLGGIHTSMKKERDILNMYLL